MMPNRLPVRHCPAHAVIPPVLRTIGFISTYVPESGLIPFHPIRILLKEKNNVEQQHTFFNFSPYLGTQSSTRERGPITTAWLEEVSDSPYLEGVLPADRTVVYWVDTVISSLSAEAV